MPTPRSTPIVASILGSIPPKMTGMPTLSVAARRLGISRSFKEVE